MVGRETRDQNPDGRDTHDERNDERHDEQRATGPLDTLDPRRQAGGEYAERGHDPSDDPADRD